MKKLGIAIAVALLALTSCGYSSKENEVIGQAKKITNETPLVCPNQIALDLSLGVIRNGTGSMSTQDVWFIVRDVKDVEKLQASVERGDVIKVKYNVLRGFSSFCLVADHEMTSFKVVTPAE